MKTSACSILFVLVFVLLIGQSCSAQPNGSQTITNWGESVSGVHLSIALSNDVIHAGPITVLATIQNQSTNIIRLIEFVGATDFDIFLIGSSGNAVKLTPLKPLSGSRVPIMLWPGQSLDWTIPVTIGKDLKPGEYMFKASRRFIANDKWFEMQSNSLKVQAEE